MTATSTPVDGSLRRVATDSLLGSVWTMVSRATGMVRIVVVAAVLGPTQFANFYQAANSVPNLLYELLIGTLFGSLLVPALVRHVDAGHPGAAARLAGRFLALSVAAAALVVVVVVAAGPLVIGLLTSGVPDGADRTDGGPAWVLLGLLLLQVPLYLAVGMAAAVQNAQGHFALPAGAPSVENVTITVVLSVYAVVIGTGATHGQGMAEVVLLGGGTTVAVLLHAAVQWWGVRRCGIRLALHWGGWRDPEVLGIARLAVPSLGYAGLVVVRYFCVLVVAAAIPGGVVALTIAWAFYVLPVALGARPVAQAVLPLLARSFHQGDDAAYSRDFARSLGLVLFLPVPAAVACALLSSPLATAIAFGEMATADGRALLRYCLLGISLGVIGQAAVEYGTLAAYARGDARRPLRAVALRTALAVVGVLGSLVVLEGPVLLLAIGVVVAVSDLVAGLVLTLSLTRPLPRPEPSLVRIVGRTCVAGAAMVPVMVLLLQVTGPATGQIGGVFVTLLVGAGGALAYVTAQWALGSPEVLGLVSLVCRSLERRAPTIVRGGERPHDRAGATVPFVAVGLLVLGVVVAPPVASAPTLGIVFAGGALLTVVTALWPVGAVIGYVALNPLLAGLDRGAVVPNLRLNEVLLVPILGGLALVLLDHWRHMVRPAQPSLHPLDWAVVTVALAGSVSPLAWMYGRGRDISTDDGFYALTLWKLVVLYVVARVFLRDVRAIRRALSALLVSAGLIGAIGVLQAVGVGAVIDALAASIPPSEGGYALDQNRATSTLGNPIAYGDLLLYAAIITAALATRLPRRARLLWTLAALLVLCALASGQASIVVGLVIAGTVFAVVTGTVKRAVPSAALFGALAFAVLQPILDARLESADPSTGLPPSWTGPQGRFENVRQYFWPEIMSDLNWVFGVRTAGRVEGREAWRQWVYIESGYVWMLWTGGVVLLVGVVVLLILIARTGRRLSSSVEPTTGALGTTLITVAWMLAGLLVFDPHLTFRGAGDVLFILLALGANLDRRASRPDAVRHGSERALTKLVAFPASGTR